MERQPDVRLAVLFGSAARDQAHECSDLDLGLRVDADADRTAISLAVSRATGRKVDLVILDEAPPLLRFEIAREGVLVLERVEHAWADFRARAMLDWWDWAPTARAMQAVAIARLRRGVADGAP